MISFQTEMRCYKQMLKKLQRLMRRERGSEPREMTDRADALKVLMRSSLDELVPLLLSLEIVHARCLPRLALALLQRLRVPAMCINEGPAVG